MNIEEAIYSKLTGTAGVAALVSTRIYPNVVPQDIAMPAVAYQRISTDRVMAHDGPTGVAMARFQFTVSASTYSSARNVVNAIRTALDGSTGLWGGASGVTIEGCFVDNEYDGYNQAGEEQVVRLDAMIIHQEA